MATAYPAAIDNFTDPTAGDNLNTAGVVHATLHTNVNDAVNAIETELGTNPKGAALSVKARLDAIDTALAARSLLADENAANGIATLDAGSMLVQNVDAGKVTTGIFAVGRIPNHDASKVTTGTFATAQIPNLDAAKTTTGIFAVARIPDLDAAKIATGTINAARLPSSVTANANSREVADVAAMNAIPVIDRVDGMIVTVRTPWTQYTYRSDSAIFVQSGGPGAISESPIEFTEGTDQVAFVNTTPGAGSVNCFSAFTAPQSGKVWIGVHANFESNLTGAIVYIGFEVRTGAAAGGGSNFVAQDNDRSIANGSTTRILCGDEWLVTGLTPGTVYNARVMHLVTSSSGDIFNRRLTIKPVH